MVTQRLKTFRLHKDRFPSARSRWHVEPGWARIDCPPDSVYPPSCQLQPFSVILGELTNGPTGPRGLNPMEEVLCPVPKRNETLCCTQLLYPPLHPKPFHLHASSSFFVRSAGADYARPDRLPSSGQWTVMIERLF